MADHSGPMHDGGHHAAGDMYGPTPAGAGHEYTDARVWPIVKFMAWLAGAALAIHFALGVLFRVFVAQSVETALPRYPLTSSDVRKLPPEPRLQDNPRGDILEFRSAEDAVLNGYGWVNKGAGVVHIPIEEAMKLTLERGLPVRPEPATPASMPSDATGGR